MRLAADLRAAVLNAAMTGKLTEQRESELSLTKSLIKTSDKWKGELPSNWCSAPISSLSVGLSSGKSPDCKKEIVSSRNEWGVLTTTAVQANNFLQGENKRLPESFSVDPKWIVNKGDVLITRAGPMRRTGVACVVDSIDYKLILSDKIIRIEGVLINPFYLAMAINAPLVRSTIFPLMNGMDKQQVNLSQKLISTIVIPVPPIEEQKRIVDRINEIMPAINEYEEMENRLVALKEAFPGNLREAILFSAIQGKLTQQYDSDEPVANLKKRLTDRKTATGVISKKDKLPMFQPTFDIPESWTWTTLSKLGTLSGGKTPSMQDAENWVSPDVNWFTSKDMKQKNLSESVMKISLKASKELQLFPSGTLLMVVRSGILKHTLPLCVLTQEATINQDLKAFTLLDNEMSEYVYWMLKGLQPEIITRYTKHVTTVDSLKMDEFFYQMPVPLPPIEEQRRIVERLNTILPLCDALAEDI